MNCSDEMRNRDEACIALPPLVFEDSEKDVGLVFTYYNSPSLFPLADKNNSNSSTVVGTSVIGAIVGGGNRTGNVTIILPFLLSVRMCYVKNVIRMCVYLYSRLHTTVQQLLVSAGISLETVFNFGILNALLYRIFLAGGRGNWTTKGCTVNSDLCSNIVSCTCDHLTNFGALVVYSCYNYISCVIL